MKTLKNAFQGFKEIKETMNLNWPQFGFYVIYIIFKAMGA